MTSLPSRRAVDAERAFLAELGGDCDLPAGAHAVVDPDDPTRLRLDAVLAAAVDAPGPPARVHLVGPDPIALGTAAARHLRTALDA